MNNRDITVGLAHLRLLPRRLRHRLPGGVRVGNTYVAGQVRRVAAVRIHLPDLTVPISVALEGYLLPLEEKQGSRSVDGSLVRLVRWAQSERILKISDGPVSGPL